MTVSIDIRARLVSPDDRVFVLFPGEKHRFYNDFDINQRVFLDFPALDLSGIVDPNKTTDWAQRLAISEKVRQWHRKKRPAGDEPSRDRKDYSGFGLTQRRSLFAGAVRYLYFDLRPNELVVVPGPGYMTDVLIGRISDSAGKFGSIEITATYPGEKIPTRRVTWLARVPKRQLSSELISRLQTPNPLTLLEKSLRDEIYRLAYPNYSYDGQFTSKLLTKKPEFTTLDDLTIQNFVNSVVAAVAAKALDYDARTLDADDTISILNEHQEFVPDLALNINSPGDLTIYAQKLVPWTIAALMALALSASAEVGFSNVQVVNSLADPADACTAAVDESVRATLDLMGYERWARLCGQIQAAADRTGLEPQVGVSHSQTPSA